MARDLDLISLRSYAYIEIALYGKPYIQAARDTWRLFKDRGIDAIVNDSLVSMGERQSVSYSVPKSHQIFSSHVGRVYRWVTVIFAWIPLLTS